MVEHGDKTAKIVATASNQKSFRQRSVPITAILLAQEAQTGAPGENHFGRSFFDIQPASKLGRIHGGSFQPREQIHVYGCGQGFECPKCSGKLHQRNGCDVRLWLVLEFGNCDAHLLLSFARILLRYYNGKLSAEKCAEEALYLSEKAAISRFDLVGWWRQGCHLQRFRGT